MERKRRWKKVARIGAIVLVAAAIFLWGTNRAVLSGAEGKIFTDLKAIPPQTVGLVLGTTPRARGGGKNLFFERRMDAAAALYKAGKVKKLLVSGDNGTPDYDEPTAMKNALRQRGVPEADIVPDYAGFRTLDSVIRARKVFGVQRCTIVTDDFHLPRALYIAADADIEAVGYQTAPLPRSISPWTYVREMGARSLVWIDLHVLHRQPKFLGRAEPI